MPAPRLLRLDARAVAADIFFRLADFFLLFLIGGFEGRTPLVAHFLVITVVARIDRRRPMLEPDNLRRHPVKEKTVVGNQEHAAPIAAQKFLQPLDHTNVQMVRRLVEKQKIRLAQKSLRETDARFLPAGQVRDPARQVRVRKAEAESHSTNAAFDVIAFHLLETLHDAPILGKPFLVRAAVSDGLFHRLFLLAETQDVRKRAEEFLMQRPRSEGSLLLYIADGL